MQSQPSPTSQPSLQTTAETAFVSLAMLLVSYCAQAQGTAQPAAPPAAPSAAASNQGTIIDRVVAVVNGEVVLESDVDEERRFAAFQPFSDGGAAFSRARAVERLINRTLILQQAKLQPQTAVSDEDVDKELMQVRREVPACKVAHCETEAGWQKFVSDQGFTLPDIRDRWRQRMQVLRFIEIRFRSGIRIPQEEIKSYYETTMLPEYQRQHVSAPKLEAISDRIQEVLLQQQVSNLLGDWLKSLRAQGSVLVMGLDEATKA